MKLASAEIPATAGDSILVRIRRLEGKPRCSRKPLPRSVACLMALGVLLSGCTGSSGASDSGGIPVPDLSIDGLVPEPMADSSGEALRDPRNMTYRKLIDGPEVQELDAVQLFRDVGVIEFLRDYIVNIPMSASFVAEYEASRARDSINYVPVDGETDAISEFEKRMLVWTSSVHLLAWTERGPDELHRAFLEALENCGRASPWPDVELVSVEGGRAGEVLPDIIESTLGLSYFEFQQVKHRCVRYAASYPTLDPELSGELLAPQRAHFAREILDRLDNELPLVEIPPEYQAEIDDMRQNGW